MTPPPDRVPRDHPLWPAFKDWAKDNLQNLMLAAYWSCWQAAYQAGFNAGHEDGKRWGHTLERERRLAERATDHSTLTPEDVE